jgi:outer membrane protein assembly factor BamB
VALELETGQLIWATNELGQHVGYYFRPWDSTTPLQIHVTRQEIITIDPTNGTVLRRVSEQEGLLTHGSVTFVGTQRELTAYDLETGKVLWWHLSSRTLSDIAQMRLWPNFIGDDVVFLSDEVTYAISRTEVRTGAIRWQTGPVYVSNIAVDETTNRLYAMRQDGALVVLDMNNGNQLDEIKFSGPLIDPHVMYYSVAVNGSYVLVHFGDTQELIALRLPERP